MEKHRVLVVDDDGELRSTISEALQRSEFEVIQARDGVEALEKLEEHPCHFVMLDVNMPRMNGLECLTKIKEKDPSTIVIIMTAYSNIEDAVRATKEGAYNYLAKPIKHNAIVEMVQKALAARSMVHSMAFSAPRIQLDHTEFVGGSSEMQRVFDVIYKLAKVDTSVLIRGESGTGKELVARALHYNSARKDQKFVAINCSSIPENLFESELFGHEKGAFTGANQRQIGKFQYAEGGTIFLDEIGDLPLHMQVKLLRVLQERKFTPVGSTREIDMDVRIVAATNRDLEEMIQNKEFREDLFYRLNVIPVFLPPLRERKDDTEKLISHFIKKFNAVHNKQIQGIHPDAAALLKKYTWPGNIRELENVMEHAFVIEPGQQISIASLPQQLLKRLGVVAAESFEPPKQKESTPSAPQEVSADFAASPSSGVTEITADSLPAEGEPMDYRANKEQFEKEFIIRALQRFNGRINQTALQANIPKKTLLRKLQKYNINPEDYKQLN